MKHLLVFFFFFIALFGFTQPYFDWGKHIAGNEDERVINIDTDSQGNVFAVGLYKDILEPDPGNSALNDTVSGTMSGFILKYDPNGSLLWQKSIKGPGLEAVGGVVVTSNDDLILTGRYNDTVDLDPGPGVYELYPTGNMNMHITKLDNDGNFIWGKSIQGNGDVNFSDLSIDTLDNVFITGSYTDSIDFDPGPGVANLLPYATSNRTFIVKLDGNGNYQWARRFFQDENYFIIGQISSHQPDNMGGLYLIGYYLGTCDFDLGPNVSLMSSAGNTLDAFVLKLDANGDFEWSKSIGGPDIDYSIEIAVATDGSLYLTGYFSDTLDLDPGPGVYNLVSPNNFDLYTVKLSAQGDFVWGYQVGGAGSSIGYSIATDSEENVYVGGSFGTTASFGVGSVDTTLTVYGGTGSDIYILKLDSSGVFQDVYHNESVGSQFVYGLECDAEDNVIASGYFDGSVDLDPETPVLYYTATGQYDGYVKKYSQCLSTQSTDSVVACGTYTWMDGNTYTASNNTAIWIETNVAGCDSIITLNLTLNNATSGTDVVMACDSLVWIDGNTYTSNNNTATYVLTNANGCDSTVTLDLTITQLNTNVTQTGIDLTADASGLSYQWLLCPSMLPIAGATNQTFSPQSNGDYAVEITDGNCVATSTCYSITTVGFSEEEMTRLKVYPNPFKDQIQVSSNTTIETLTLITLSGKELMTVSGQNAIDVKDVASGTYLLLIESEGKTLHRFVTKW